MPDDDANARQRLSRLQNDKEERLKDLLKLKPGQKHYHRALKTYLEADALLQRAIIERLGLDFHE